MVARILRDAGSIGLSNFLVIAAQFLLNVITVRGLRPEIFGAYSVALAIETIIESVLVARSGEMAFQYIGKAWVNKDYNLARAYAEKIIRLDVIVNCSLYGLVSVCSILVSRVFGFDPTYLILLNLMVPAQIGYGVYKSLFVCTSKLKHQAVLEGAFAITQLVLGGLGLLFFGVFGIIAALIVSALTKTLVAKAITEPWWPATNRNDNSLDMNQSLTNLESLTGSGIHSILRNGFSNLANQIDFLLISGIQGPHTAAIYRVAKILAILPSRVAGPVWSALRPSLLKAWHTQNTRQISRVIIIPSAIMMMFLVLALVPLSFYVHEIVCFLYGAEYRSAGVPFLILFVGGWIFGAVTAWFGFVVLLDSNKITSTLIYAFMLVNIFGGGAIFGKASPIDMALVTSATLLFTSVFCWLLLFRRLRHFRSAEIGFEGP